MNFSKFFLIFFSLVWGILGSIMLVQSKDIAMWLKISTISLGVFTWFSLLFVTYNVKYETESESETKKKESK